MLDSLPDKKLDTNKELSNAFIEKDIFSFIEACDYIWKLPYGRTSDRANWRLVLTEERGACSTKHALLKALADELALDIELVIGIYPMTGKNTLGIEKVLLKHGLDFIPEAHCYLKHQGIRVDLTRFNAHAEEPIKQFFSEINIAPNDIGDTKLNFHREYIYSTYGDSEFSKIWAVREECIAAIST